MIHSIFKLVTSLLRFAHPNGKKTTVISNRHLLLFSFLLSISTYTFSDDYYSWRTALGQYPSPSAIETCDAFVAAQNGHSQYLTFISVNSAWCYYKGSNNANAFVRVDRTGTGCPPDTIYNDTNGKCEAPEPCLGDSVRDEEGACTLSCQEGTHPDPETMTCQNICPVGKFWDFESESCKYPEDEQCPTGSNWSPETQDCVCDGDGILSNTAGFRICMAPADNECTVDSPDFIGMVNGVKPYCNGRARCPNGTKLGAVGKGENSEWVCIPDQGSDESCPGGQSGNFNGQQVCVPRPGDPGNCKEGETTGFAGSGENMTPICVPSNYKPETCPPGQYTWNVASEGFACVKLPNQPKDPIQDDPNTPEDERKIAYQGSATTVTKDAEGNVTGTSEMEFKFPEEGIEIKDLLIDEPQTDYFKDFNEFSDSQLETLDEPHQEFLDDITSGDGSFTERGKLDQASDLIGSLFGTGVGCTGQLVLGQYKGHQFAASCEKLSRMKDLFSWFIYITTIMGIYNVLMRPPVS